MSFIEKVKTFYDTSTVLVKNIIAAVILSVFIIFGSFLFLNIFTNHGDALSVPDFTGLKLDEAIEIADDKDLEIMIVDTVYVGSVPPGSIVAQNPPKDFQVKEGRRIFVTIKSLTSETVSMPNLVEATWIVAKSKLAAAGLSVGSITFQKHDYKYFTVLEQRYNGKKIKAGAKITKGEKVDFVLSRKDDFDNLQMPDLAGLDYYQAIKVISDNMLNLKHLEYDETVISYQDSIQCTVYKQFPGKNTAVKPGANVDIYFSMMNDTIE